MDKEILFGDIEFEKHKFCRYKNPTKCMYFSIEDDQLLKKQ